MRYKREDYFNIMFQVISRVKYDKERTKYLESAGLKVIRFENQEVLYDTD